MLESDECGPLKLVDAKAKPWHDERVRIVWRRYQNASTRDSMLCRFSVPGTVAGSANAVCGM